MPDCLDCPLLLREDYGARDGHCAECLYRSEDERERERFLSLSPQERIAEFCALVSQSGA